MTTSYKQLQIKRYDQDTVVISSSNPACTVVFDPFQSQGTLNAGTKADVVFISHDHFDHFSPKDIQALENKNTLFVFPASILDKVQTFLDVPPERLIPVVPLEEYTISVKDNDIKVMAVPAYNVDKRSPQGNLYHPKDKEYVGYVLDIGGISVYFVGDSDPVLEMDALRDMVEVMFVPISGVYVMTVEEAVVLTEKICPKLAVPMHFGTIIGERSLGEQFKQKLQELAPEIQIEI